MNNPESPASEAPREATAGAGATPEASSESKPKKLFDVHIYRDWCKGCGICAALCPKQVLSRNEEGGPVVVDPEACIGCGWCELHCPDFAISVRPRPEKEEATS
jgi:2-oxoglutarate ferredoxin oxidoreductase subunit delta